MPPTGPENRCKETENYKHCALNEIKFKDKNEML